MAYTFNTLNAAVAAATTNSDIATIIANIQSDMAGNPSVYIPVYVRKVNEQLGQFDNTETFFRNFYFLTNGSLLFVQFGNINPPFTPPTPAPALPYLVYSGKITQVGTADPTVVIFQNTIGALVWTLQTNGIYKATLAGAFTVDKTFVMITQPILFGTHAQPAIINPVNADVVDIRTFTLSADVSGVITGTPTDQILNGTCFEIRVYP